MDNISFPFLPEVFYKDSHQKIATAILKLRTNNKKIDILTVEKELQKSNEIEDIGGCYYLILLTQKVASAYNIDEHYFNIFTDYLKRELIRKSTELNGLCYDYSIGIDELVEFSEKEFFNIINNYIANEPIKIDALLPIQIELYKKLAENKDELIGIPSGFTKVDRITSGWQKSDFIILAARPSIGKTYISLHKTIFPAKLGKSIAFFSLEMSKEQLVNRMVSIETGISQDNLRNGNLTGTDLFNIESKTKELNNLNIFIDDTPALDVFQFRSKARKLKLKYNIDLIIIDYLQLMTVKREKGDNRERQISIISQTCKQVAKELNIPVIALSQLNRDAEGKVPNLSNLRESGSLEQDADIVIFLHREKEQDSSYSLFLDMIIAKHRNGKTGSVTMKLSDESMTSFDNDEPF
jgi:replicative DNA helicase